MSTDSQQESKPEEKRPMYRSKTKDPLPKWVWVDGECWRWNGTHYERVEEYDA